MGSLVMLSLVFHGVKVNFYNYQFFSNLVVLVICDFDCIHAKDWLTSYRVLINGFDNTITFQSPEKKCYGCDYKW